MSQAPQDRPYVQAWLKRVDRELRGSGRLTQVAYSLSLQHGGSREDWSRQLRDILSGKQQPGVELIADVDQLLAKPASVKHSGECQFQLF